MVNISIDVTDLGGEARPGDKVVLWKPAAAGSSSHAGRVISTAPVDVFLTSGKASVPDVEPGEMRVLLQCRGVESQGPIDVVVPDGTGTVTLRSLIESQFEYAPPIVSAVQEAAANASASEEAAIRAQVRSEAAADRADAKVDDAINNGANLVRNEVKQDADRAVSARQAAMQSESKAAASENAAASSASNAATSETNAKQSETNAGDFAAVATTAATEAVDAMESANDAATSIGNSVTEAAGHADRAEQHESGAAAYAQNASDSADRVGTAEQVGTWAQQAQDAADRIGTAETVEGWANSARDSASAAGQSETKAKEYRDAALGAASSTANELRGDLINIVGDASSHATDASRSAARAKTSETNAATYEANSLSAAERAEFAAEETIQQVEGDFATRNYADSKAWVRRSLLDGEDLNVLTEAGLYLITTSGTMQSLNNRPLGAGSPGFLAVINSGGTIIQELAHYSDNGPVTMSRVTLGGVFQEWVNPAAATKRFQWTDMNDAVIEGDYDIGTSAPIRNLVNAPTNSPSAVRISVRRAGGTRLIQDWVGIVAGGIGERWQRNRNSFGVWESWEQVRTDISRAEVLSLLEDFETESTNTDHVVTVGDSQVGVDYAWANLLAGVSGQTVVNRGKSGNTPDEALLMTGGWRLPIEPVTLIPGERVPVSFAGDSPVMRRDFSYTGYVLGERVSLWYTHSTGSWEALLIEGEEPLTLSSPTLWASIYADYAPEKLSRRIVWFGGNSIRNGLHRPDESLVDHVKKAYSRAIEAWGKTTIVCGYVPAYGDTVGRDAANELNAWLADTVPTQFLDMRYRIQLAAADILGRELTTSEQQDIANGYLPQPLYRSDLVHLTDEAHVKIAEIVAEFPNGASPQISIRSNPSPVVSLSGAGSPEGKFTAPVGSTYTDTAATNGAIRWIKTSGTGATGWRVEYGDTGWRDVTSLLLNGWNATRVRIRRQNNTVMLSTLGLTAANATSSMFISLPNTFHIPKTFVGIMTPNRLQTAYWNASQGLSLWNFDNWEVNEYADSTSTWTVETSRGWPTTLPGSPV